MKLDIENMQAREKLRSSSFDMENMRARSALRAAPTKTLPSTAAPNAPATSMGDDDLEILGTSWAGGANAVDRLGLATEREVLEQTGLPSNTMVGLPQINAPGGVSSGVLNVMAQEQNKAVEERRNEQINPSEEYSAAQKLDATVRNYYQWGRTEEADAALKAAGFSSMQELQSYLSGTQEKAQQGNIASAYYHTKGWEDVTKFRSSQQAWDLLKQAANAAYNAKQAGDLERYTAAAGGSDTGETSSYAYKIQQDKLAASLVALGYDAELVNSAIAYAADQIAAYRAAEANSALKKAADEAPVVGALASVLMSPAQGLDIVEAALGNIGHNNAANVETYRPFNESDFAVTGAVQGLREGATADLGSWGKFFANTGMSMADSVWAIALGPAGSVVLGLSAASNTAKDVMNRGGTNNQALLAGAAAGVAEAAFEKLSIEKLLNAPKTGVKGEFWLNMARQSFTEASEEACTEIANILADAVIMGQNSNFNAAVEAYLKENPNATKEEATRKAFLDNVAQVALAAAGGALSGAGMTTVFNGAPVLLNKATDYAVKNQVGRALSQHQYDMLVVAQRFADGSDTRVLADKIATSIEQSAQNGKVPTISAATWGELATLMESQRDEFGPKLEDGSVDASVEQALHPDEAVMSATAEVFRDAGDDSKTADTKSKILDKIAAGDTTVTDTELRKLDLNSQSTRAAFKTVLGVELPGVTDRAVLFSAARNAAQSIADANAVQAQPEQVTAQPEQVATPEQVQTQPEQVSEVEQQVQDELDAIEAEARRMADAVAPAAAQEDAQASAGEIPSAQNVAENASAGASKSLLDYVGGVVRKDADVRAQAQKLTVDTLNSMLANKKSRTRITLQALGKDGVNGQWTGDGNVVLNSDRMGTGDAGAQFAIYWTLTHELFHEAVSRSGGGSSAWTTSAEARLDELMNKYLGSENWAAMKAEAYDAQLAAHVNRNMTERKMTREAATEAAKQTLTDEFMREEYAADALRWVFFHTDALNKFAGENRGIVVKIRDWLQNKFSDLLAGNVAADKTAMRTMNELVKKVNEALTNTEERATDKERSGVKFSVTPEMDAEYMDAVNNGDMETAQRMVDEAAKKAGYTVKSYHGSHVRFNVFSHEYAGGLFNFTPDKDAAQRYAFGGGGNRGGETVAISYDGTVWEYDEDIDAYIAVGKANDYVEKGSLEIAPYEGKPAAVTRSYVHNSLTSWEGDGEFELVPKEANTGSFFINPKHTLDLVNDKETARRVFRGVYDEFNRGGHSFTGTRESEVGRVVARLVWSYENDYDDFWGITKQEFAHRAFEDFVVPELKKLGYDSIYHSDDGHKTYAVFDPNQIKSADPVTYDADGDVIPLSERFNPENDDIRYSAGAAPSATDFVDQPWADPMYSLMANLADLDGTEVWTMRIPEQMRNDILVKGQPKFSAPTLADTNTPEFRAWFNDDSGELTNPDGTPKMLLRGSPLSGSTKFRDYRESYSPGIFLTPDLYAAKNYATARSTRSEPTEFVPRVLNSWRDAYWWVENGGLGNFVSLEQEGPDEWVFAKRNAMFPTRWDTVATFSNDQAGLDKFNAEYGDLMRNEVFGTGKAQNPGYMKLYATATKTKVIDAEGRVWLNADGQWGKTDDVVRQAWDEGYDCVVIKNVQDGGEEIGVGFDENDNWVTQQKPIDVIIVKDSGQVKSVYNTGAFERNNPDVRYSADPKKPTYKTGGNTGNVNPETGYERGSIADSFVRMWNVGAEDEAIGMLEDVLNRLANIESERAEQHTNELRRAAFTPRVTESVAERNKARIERLIEKYGAMEQTSAAQQEVRLPKQIDDETHVAGFAQTAMAAEVTNEVIADELKQDILNGSAGLTYSRIGDKPTLEQVDREYEKMGFDAMLTLWRNEFNDSKTPTKLDIARAEKLYVEACANKDVETALQLAAEIAAAGTRAGQTVQAMTLLKKMTPSGQLYYFQKTVDRMNKDKRQKNPITIDPAIAEKLLKAKTREELDAAIDELIAHIAKQVPVTFEDKWNTWRYFAMLGNPRTHIRNLLGNAIFEPARLAKDIVGTMLERALPAEQRTKVVVIDKAMMDFAKQDADDMEAILRGSGKYNPADLIRDRRTIYPKLPWLEKAVQANSKLLEKEDWVFLKRAYSRALAGFLTARGVSVSDNIMGTKEGRQLFEEARAYAVKEAQRATYRDTSKLANWLSNAKRQHWAASVFLDGIVPFTKTPINIVKRGLEYSPLGLFKTGFDFANRIVALKQLEKGETVKRDYESATDIINELAANLTGTGVALLGVLLSHLGLLVAGLGEDDKDKFKELYGEQAYSIKVGDVSYTIDWTAPVALPLFVGAEIYNTLSADYSDVGEGQLLTAIFDGVTTILEPMLSLSMLAGINDALSANKFGDSEDALWTLLSSAATSYVSQGAPTVLGQIARVVDPNRRTVFVEKGTGKTEAALQRLWQSSVQGKIPFYERGKMAYVDAWGRVETSGHWLVRAVENFLSPGYVNMDKKTDVETELERLLGTTKDKGVLPDRAAKYFSVWNPETETSEEYAMSKDEYEAHLIDRGQTSYKLVSDFVNDPVYADLTDKQRAAVIDDIYAYAAQSACYHTNDAYQRQNWVENLDAYIAEGGDAVDFLYAKTQSDSENVSVSEVVYGMGDLTAAETRALLRFDTSASQRAPEKFADPGSSGREYSMTAEQQSYYTDLWDDLFNEEFADLYNSRKYQNADPEERAELVKELRADVTKEVKRDVERWLRQQGVRSTKK